MISFWLVLALAYWYGMLLLFPPIRKGRKPSMSGRLKGEDQAM